MRRAFFIIFSILTAFAQAQEVVYTAEDSVFITRIAEKQATRAHTSPGELALAVAQEFVGQKYVAGTLDTHSGEPLFLSATQLDCTTFVELVLAISLSIKEGKNSFEAVCHNLQKIRYRDGVRRGYTSRLHYISWWIENSKKLNIATEIKSKLHRRAKLNLHYMSSHPANYNQLKNNPALTQAIDSLEKPFRGKNIYYIPKEMLGKTKEELCIENGDIIAITTNIDGLDVVHIGFAFWEGEKLHLLHASSSEGRVIKDKKDLYSYQKGKKSHTGVRVFRIK